MGKLEMFKTKLVKLNERLITATEKNRIPKAIESINNEIKRTEEIITELEG